MIEQRFLSLIRGINDFYKFEEFANVDIRDSIAIACLGFEDKRDIDYFWGLFASCLKDGEKFWDVKPSVLCERVLKKSEKSA